MLSVLLTILEGEGLERAFVVAEGPTVLGHDEEVDVLVVEGLTGFLDGLVLASASALLPTVTTVGEAHLVTRVGPAFVPVETVFTTPIEVVLLTDDRAENGKVAQLEEFTNLVFGVVVAEEGLANSGRVSIAMNVYSLNRPIGIDDSNV
jgi:hypothetical protein